MATGAQQVASIQAAFDGGYITKTQFDAAMGPAQALAANESGAVGMPVPQADPFPYNPITGGAGITGVPTGQSGVLAQQQSEWFARHPEANGAAPPQGATVPGLPNATLATMSDAQRLAYYKANPSAQAYADPSKFDGWGGTDPTYFAAHPEIQNAGGGIIDGATAPVRDFATILATEGPAAAFASLLAGQKPDASLNPQSLANARSDVQSSRDQTEQFTSALANFKPTVATPVVAPTLGTQTPEQQRAVSSALAAYNAHGITKAQYDSIVAANQPGPAHAAGTNIGPAAQASAAKLGPAQTMAAANVGPVAEAKGTAIGAPVLGPAAQAGTTSAQAASIAAAPAVQAATIAPVERAAAQTFGGATLDTSQQDQARANQQQLVKQLQDQVAGTGGPSPAEMMLRRQAQTNVANQQAFVAQARGSNIGAAQRTAAVQTAKLNSDADYQSALLRAQEQQQARAQLGTQLDSQRGADISVAGTAAGLKQTAGLANLDTGTKVALANTGAANQAASQQAGLTQQAGTDTAKIAADRNTAQAGFIQGAALANAGEANQTARANAAGTNQQNQAGAQMQLAASQSNQDVAARTSQANAAATNRAGEANAGFVQQAAQLNQQAGNQFAIEGAQFQQQAAIQNAAQTNQQAQAQGSLTQQTTLANTDAKNEFMKQVAVMGLQAATTNQAAALQAQGLNDEQIRAYMQSILGSTSNTLTGDTNILSAEAAAKGAANQQSAANQQFIATLGAGLISKLP